MKGKEKIWTPRCGKCGMQEMKLLSQQATASAYGQHGLEACNSYECEECGCVVCIPHKHCKPLELDS